MGVDRIFEMALADREAVTSKRIVKSGTSEGLGMKLWDWDTSADFHVRFLSDSHAASQHFTKV